MAGKAGSARRGLTPVVLTKRVGRFPMKAILLTAATARQRRADLLASVGGDEAALRVRAAAFMLDAKELAVWDEITGLDYLLGATNIARG